MGLPAVAFVDLVWRVVATWVRPPLDHLRAPFTELEDEGGSGHERAPPVRLGDLVTFRGEFYDCLARRGDVLFELTHAVRCTEGLVRSLVSLSLAPERRVGMAACMTQ